MKLKRKLDIQKVIDELIDRFILRFIPHTVKPNHVTAVRFALIPVIYLLLRSDNFGVALLIFVLAASTDFIDGAMARTRDQITDLGKVIDPIADKLLIMSVFLYVGFDYLIVKIFVIFIILEIGAVILGVFFSFLIGRPAGANFFGKIKMILQSFSVGFFILGMLVNNTFLIGTSEYILFFALAFAALAGLESFRLRLKQFCKRVYNKTDEQKP